MMEQVYISGPLGKAVFKDGGRYFALRVGSAERPVECRPADLSLFFDFNAEYVTLPGDVADTSQVRDALEFRSKAHRALSLLLSGLDAELDNDTRSLAIEASEELLRREPTHGFVRARLLSHPVPDAADLEGAQLLAEYTKSSGIKSLYGDMHQAREAIPALLDTWDEVALEHFDSRDSQAEGEKLMADYGVFADVAMALASGNLMLLDNAVVKYSLDAGLREKLPQISHVLNSLRSRLIARGHLKTTKTATEGREQSLSARSQKGARTFNVREIFKRFKRGRGEKRARTFTADEAKEKVDHQIEAIKEQIRRGHLDRAERYVQDLIRFHVAHSEKKHLGMSLCSLAKTAIDFHALELAETMMSYAFSLGVEDVVILTTQAELFKAIGQLSEALMAYDEAVRLFPKNVVVRSGRAEVLKEMGRLSEALAAYEDAVRLLPSDAVIRNGLAEVLKEMGRFGEALDAYGDTLRLFPEDIYARTGLAEVLKEMGRFGEALDAYGDTLRLFPENVVAHNGRAETLRAMGRLPEALAAYEETTRLFPGDAVTRNGLAEVLKGMGRFDEALAAYDSAVGMFPENAVVCSGRAQVLKAMGRLPEALVAYEEIKDLFPDDIFARTGRAEVLKEMGRLPEALAAYEEAMRLFPENAVARTGRASLLMLMNRISEARGLLSGERLMTRDDWIDYHILAMSYMKTGEVDEAIRRLTYGLENTPWVNTKTYFANALGVARIMKKEFEEAVQVLETNVVNLNVFQKQKQMAFIGHSHAALGRRDAAIEALSSVEPTSDPHLQTLRKDLVRRFTLDPSSSEPPSENEVLVLDERIEEKEFYLAMAA